MHCKQQTKVDINCKYWLLFRDLKQWFFAAYGVLRTARAPPARAITTKTSFDCMSMKQMTGKYVLDLRLFIAEPSFRYLKYF